jgi:hypothetical protein
MIGRMVKKAVFGAVGTWAWRQGRQWWDEREGKPATGARRTTGTRRR